MAIMLTERMEFGRLLELAERRELGEFRVSADRFPRLRQLLADDQPDELQVRVAFSPMSEDLPQLALRVQGRLGLVCQRCLGAIEWPLGIEAELSMVVDDSAAELLADPFDSITVPAEGLRLSEVIEDEILAALPIAVSHVRQEECRPAAAGEDLAARTTRPFSSLRELMQRRDGGSKPN